MQNEEWIMCTLVSRREEHSRQTRVKASLALVALIVSLLFYKVWICVTSLKVNNTESDGCT